MDNGGYPSQAPITAGEILRAIAGAATLSLGTILYGQGTPTAAILPAPSSPGQFLTGSPTAPAWSGSSLTYVASTLAATGGTAPATQGATAWSVGAGVGRWGTQVQCDGTAADSIQTAGGITASGQLSTALGNGLSLNGIATGTYDLHSVGSGQFPIRLALAADAVTQRSFDIGHYTGDTRAGAWNSRFSVNGYTGSATFAAGITMAGALSGVTTIVASSSIACGAGSYFSAQASGSAAPSIAARSVGTKVILYDTFSAGVSADVAIGVESGFLWFGGGNGAGHKWYTNTTNTMLLSSSGALTTAAGITCTTVTASSAIACDAVGAYATFRILADDNQQAEFDFRNRTGNGVIQYRPSSSTDLRWYGIALGGDALRLTELGAATFAAGITCTTVTASSTLTASGLAGSDTVGASNYLGVGDGTGQKLIIQLDAGNASRFWSYSTGSWTNPLTLSGSTPGTPSAGRTLIGGGDIKTYGGITAGGLTHVFGTAAATGQTYVTINGGDSGTGGGPTIVLKANGAGFLALGSKSSVLGGAYDGTRYLYTAGAGITCDAGITCTTLRLSALPTSTSGLSAGDIWNDSGTLKIV
jgi:hypothetical protein